MESAIVFSVILSIGCNGKYMDIESDKGEAVC